ncbi:NAD+ synthase [Haliea sp.]|jgi:NAD+ synthase (glutamine-hydrolysing)|uniref:NAD+ synthase n=1 Tax=Haliea TaxID=475794 RepID=UPI000C5F1D8A|nr:NAD+ synthase [Haliea sp.]MAD64744.1 NAD+ synthase [Haliea sp.]MAY94250.1 NAD+ synthase [Haliea sp.]MBP70944.1 NAD+ synthase [Haliea sp.]HCD56684.1 NAD+ synthase [Halieaceae bacterium]|tara:strand:- start:2299 stop:3930 length:1632 start_codon:yes stop_codon:yes gene_type:complete
MSSLNIVMVQMNTLVGDFEGNTAQVIEAMRRAEAKVAAPVLVFPELTLSGYPPEDLLLRPSIELRVNQSLQAIKAAMTGDAWLVIGYPRREGIALYNVAAVLHHGEIVAEYRKQCLPNYQVFDEMRYFQRGDSPCVVQIQGIRVGLTVCEDIWEPGPVRDAAQAGAELVLNLNASPYHRGKRIERWELVAERASSNRCPIVYVNQVGGQDELVFDGGSFAVDDEGERVVTAPNFVTGEYWLTAFREGERVCLAGEDQAPALDELEATWQALVLGLRDYVNKNRFRGVVLGLSGGIDSALTLAVAVEALGSDRVEAVMMPFRYTAQMSVEDAAEQSALLGVAHKVISIEPMYEAFMAALEDEFAGTRADTTEENLQARCRGVLLMSISNKKGLLVLTTGNKSELAVGYSTLYGDMAGGFDVLKDVPKTLVFELSRYRNSIAPCIPQRVIDRPPSAELAPDQKDEDSLPPYPVLDRILELYVEQDFSAAAIIASGMDSEQVHRVLRLVDLNEYKRRQAPIGVRITRRGFGRDRRYPITSAWTPGD